MPSCCSCCPGSRTSVPEEKAISSASSLPIKKVSTSDDNGFAGSPRTSEMEKYEDTQHVRQTFRRSSANYGGNHGKVSKRRCSREDGKQVKGEKDETMKGTFVDAAAMKEKVREKLSKPKYSVTDFYYETGVCQLIARSPIFDKLTLIVIGANALWISIDTDYNHEALLMEADVQFIIAENLFCLFFSFEWLVRFGAFRRKRDGLRDGWFVFDSFMVSMMVIETWIFSFVVLILSSGSGGFGGNAGLLRLARLLRLSRMARMGKLLRVMPELMIMIKGMKAATRSVFFTLLLLVVIMYIFAIAFVQLSEDTPVGEKYFAKVYQSMYHLLIYGIFLDNVGQITNAMDGSWVLPTLFFLFVLLGTLTIMNMLVGVLCEVVSAVAATEQEEMLVNYVNEKISRVMTLLDQDGGGSISKKEFMMILENVEAVRCLNDVGVDVFALIDLTDYIFEDDDTENDEEIELDFSRFMEVVLQLRGTNQATVKDIVDLRKFMRLSMQENYRQTSRIVEENYKQTSMILETLKNGAKLSEDLMAVVSGKPVDRNHSKAIKPLKISQKTNGGSQVSSEAGDSVAESKHSDAESCRQDFSPTRYSVESGVPPSLPRSTPDGQLLCWVPILHSDINPHEDIGLKGSWENLDHFEDWIPSEDDPRTTSALTAREDAKNISAAAHVAKHGGNSISNGIDTGNNHSAWHPASHDVLRYSRAESTQDGREVHHSEAIRIPRLCIHTSDGMLAYDDAEFKALQLQFETICGQLAAGLNDAIDMAGRSVARRYAGKLGTGLTTPELVGGNKQNAKGDHYDL